MQAGTIDFWTKNSHYRVDIAARTVECIGPKAFPPQAVAKFERTLRTIAVGCLAIVRWADGVGPMGKAVMQTSFIQRVQENKPTEGW